MKPAKVFDALPAAKPVDSVSAAPIGEEQVRGGLIDKRTVFGNLGIVLYEMVASPRGDRGWNKSLPLSL